MPKKIPSTLRHVDDVVALAHKVGTDYSHVLRVLKGTRQSSPALALAIHKATRGRVHKATLRPDLWGPQSK